MTTKEALEFAIEAIEAYKETHFHWNQKPDETIEILQKLMEEQDGL